MWAYFLKRLLLVLPTVWLIGSLVFLLSRIIPGSHIDLSTERAQSMLGGGNQTQNRAKYLRHLQEIGQDKPLFYFSVNSQAQPDTLKRVFPQQHQTLLQELLNHTGNWPAVVAYYQSLLQLQSKATANADTIPAPAIPAEPFRVLMRTAEPDIISHALQEIKPFERTYNLPVTAVQTRFSQMQQQAQPIKLLLPKVRWHGRNNQYHQWLLQIVRGNFGRSFITKEPVVNVLRKAIGNTLLLLAGSMVLTFVLSIRLTLALLQWRKGQQLVLNSLYVLDSIPLFIIAQLLFTYLAGNIFPIFDESEVDAKASFVEKILDQLPALVLPAICLLVTSLPYITAQLYQTLQQVLKNQFIITARAKGLPEEQVLSQHAFRNALLPLITLFTGSLPVIIAGALVIEYIFDLPGTGRLLVNVVSERDYPVMIGLVLLMAIIQALAHVLADLLYFLADPRTRLKLA